MPVLTCPECGVYARGSARAIVEAGQEAAEEHLVTVHAGHGCGLVEEECDERCPGFPGYSIDPVCGRPAWDCHCIPGVDDVEPVEAPTVPLPLPLAA